MSNKFEKYATSIANSSGFPLQIRIANIVKSHPDWQVLLEEHPWHHDMHDLQGFLDLVIVDRFHKLEAMVIECKRVKQTAWVFLIPKSNPIKRRHARLFESRHTGSEWEFFDWTKWQVDPPSYESQFCAIPGQQQGHRNLLERTASELAIAVSAFAFQESNFQESRSPSQQFEFNRIYIPIVVTTANLIVSYFDPETISLKNGSLPSDAGYETVPSVRFRKSLTTISPKRTPPQSIEEAHIMTERTVFIVNAEGFQEFLNNWHIE
jgi:hypothetical protein